METRGLVPTFLVFALLCVSPATALAQTPAAASGNKSSAASWKFAVSGDSRNCGDVVMPAIAVAAKRDGASFYWHLGDFRKIFDIDEDIQHQAKHAGKPLTKPEYEDLAWKDFIESQIKPFGSVPVYLARGNHENIPPKTREEYLAQFSEWLDAPNLRAQRLHDNPADLNPKTYYHWVERGVDFITLDNGSEYEFDADQLVWFEKVLRADSSTPAIRTIVVGMHEALPESVSKGHSMNESQGGIESGRRVYADLLKAQNKSHKRVYILSSHSHFFADGIFQTEYWREHGGVLPGWIVGTAGAERYKLPPETKNANAAQTNVYGLLLGAVSPSGRIQFDFQRLTEQDLLSAVGSRYAPEFVHWCFAENSQAH